MPASETLLESVIRHLQSRKGQWRTVAEESGVPYKTLQKIADGTHKDPRFSQVQKLADYFQENGQATV
jgi:predicted transcriptional regulator